jgi:transposase
MDDRQLYTTILGLTEPWLVEGVEVAAKAGEVLVRLAMRDGTELRCPDCEKAAPGYDQASERRWRHLDTCQYRTVLVARIPRVECPEHGVRQIAVPWSEGRSRFTALFEALAIRLLRETTLSGLCRVMGLSWDEAEGILDRAVKRGLARRDDDPARVIGVDETSFRKGHQYITVVSDLERDRVLWVGEDRKKTTLAAYWSQLPDAHLAAIREVVMDMWEPYIRATLAAVPDADSKIVIDRYHVAHLLTDGVDRVRRAEHRVLRSLGDDRLTGTRFIWIKGAAKRRPSDELRIRQLRTAGLKVGRAWALKEASRRLWTYRYRGWALKYFKRWYYWATHSQLRPMIRVARTMKRYLPWILNYLRSQSTNAGAEAINAKIQEVKYRARGFRNRANFRRAILFYCGRLDMNPL